MTPRGAAPLIAMRTDGQRPAGDVWITVSHILEADWWRWANSMHCPELIIRPTDPVERLDLRCVVGMRVVFFFPEWTEQVGRLYERLQEYVTEIAVMSPTFEGDIGWYWLEDHGRVEFDDRWRIDALIDAKASAVNAAIKGDMVAYQTARAREAAALGGAQWPR
ncbi:MAG TPA: hypothetical protein VGK09_10710 [Rhodocyclaceae bacterium]